METHYKDIDSYCAEHIEDYELRVQRALTIIDRYRCPLYMADRELYREMTDAIVEWCDENDYAIDFFEDIDPEEILFNA